MAIASCLIDTNILLRLARRSDPLYSFIRVALPEFEICVSHLSHKTRKMGHPTFLVV